MQIFKCPECKKEIEATDNAVETKCMQCNRWVKEKK